MRLILRFGGRVEGEHPEHRSDADANGVLLVQIA